jgi:uncharacterized cupredoxin-like copper-binding protein
MLEGCGGLQKQVIPSAETTELVVEMQASSFSFVPNNLKVYTGNDLVFKIRNLSDTNHNFTITGPEGEIIKDVALPANEMTEVKVNFMKSGTYQFYCNKPFHNTLGMKGQAVVLENR